MKIASQIPKERNIKVMKWLMNLESKLLQKTEVRPAGNATVSTYLFGIRLAPTQLERNLELEWEGSPRRKLRHFNQAPFVITSCKEIILRGSPEGPLLRCRNL